MLNIGIFRSRGNLGGAVLAWWFLTSRLSAQGFVLVDAGSARTAALGGAAVALGSNPWSVVANPAGLADSSSVMAAVGMRPAMYGLTELRVLALGLTWASEEWGVGCVITRMGGDLFLDQAVALGGGAVITPEVIAGAGATVREMRFERYGGIRFWTLSLGLLIKVADNAMVGSVAENPTRNWIVRGLERAPTRLRAGAAFAPVGTVTLSAEVEKEVGFSPTIKGGLEKRFLGILSVRAGMTTDPDTYSGGVGVSIGSFQAGVALSYHADLGWTELFELQYLWLNGGNEE